MKRLVFSIIIFLFIVAKGYPQAINSILVPGSTGASFTQASNEFYTYSTTYDGLTLTASDITSLLGYNISWSEPMLMYNAYNYSWPKWTAFAVIAFAQAYRYETDATRKSYYETKAKRGAEFLLWLESAVGQDGGIPDQLISGSSPNTTGKGIFTTGTTGTAFVECYLSFGDQKYYDAAKRTVEWQLSNPGYPYTFPGDLKHYYSNVNHLARAVWLLSEVYKITGDQRYLDRAIQIAEEIIAWQDYQDSRDPWGEAKNPDGTWDGGWYWYDYSATSPLPSGVETPPGGGFAAERRMDYHTATVYGLIKLLEVTEQQILPGTTTIRNSVSFPAFKSSLISSIKKALNYMINNQEQSSTYTYQYRGLFKSYKNYKMFGGDATFDGYNYGSAPHGLSVIIDGYLALLKSNYLTSQDQTRLVSLINGVSENMIGKYTGSWQYENWRTEGMMINWCRCMYYKSLATINSTLSLVNTSFEDKNIIWELWSWDGSGVNVSSAAARTGNNSIHIIDNSTTAGKWASLLVTATPNTTYKAEAYLHLLSGYQAIYIHYYDAAYNLIDYGYTLAIANSSFQKVSIQRTAPSNAAYLRITLYSSFAHTSDGYWDDVLLSIVLPKMVASKEVDDNIEYAISNYPNPFNPMTTISYTLPEDGRIQIKVFDALGREITTLIDSFSSAGKHSLVWDGSNVASGVYFYSITFKGQTLNKKMLLVK